MKRSGSGVSRSDYAEVHLRGARATIAPRLECRELEQLGRTSTTDGAENTVLAMQVEYAAVRAILSEQAAHVEV